MFDQPPSLPMRAAIASFLGGLFGIALILLGNSANAQTQEMAASAQADSVAQSAAATKRLSDIALRSVRGPESTIKGGSPGSRGLRINDSSSQTGTGLRWQMAPRRVLRSELEHPRGGDQLSLGLLVRF